MKEFVRATFALGAAMAAGLTLSHPARADDNGQNVQVAQAAPSVAEPAWFAWRDHNWTGIYLGPQIGYDIGHTRFEFPGELGGQTSANRTNDVPVGGFTAGFDLQQPGVGWGWPTPPWLVAGLELNADLINGSSSSLCVNPTYVCTSSIDWLATLGPRVGYATGPLLVYGTGGFAAAQTRASITAGSGTAGNTGQKRGYGWSAGAGVQYAASDAISLRLEDSYFRVSSSATGVVPTDQPIKLVNYGNLIHLALVFQFGAPSAPPAATPVVAAPPAPPPAAAKPAKQMFIVFFEFDKSSLTPDGKKVVDAAATAFKSGKSDIALAGYTDLAGSQQYNLALSKRRADTVKAALVKDGVPASAIGESWYGKQNPRVPTADGVREPQNRRVEITM
jgi:outer membrane protein OmpA-like peptidoglycan-associated protein